MRLMWKVVAPHPRATWRCCRWCVVHCDARACDFWQLALHSRCETARSLRWRRFRDGCALVLCDRDAVRARAIRRLGRECAIQLVPQFNHHVVAAAASTLPRLRITITGISRRSHDGLLGQYAVLTTLPASKDAQGCIIWCDARACACDVNVVAILDYRLAGADNRGRGAMCTGSKRSGGGGRWRKGKVPCCRMWHARHAL